MEYKLTIIRQEKNPNWTPCLSPYQKEENQYSICDQILEVVLNEQEFQAVKKGVIEVIK